MRTSHRAIGIDTARLVSLDEIREMTGGLIRTEDVIGSLNDSNDANLNPFGADVILRIRVLELNSRRMPLGM